MRQRASAVSRMVQGHSTPTRTSRPSIGAPFCVGGRKRKYREAARAAWPNPIPGGVSSTRRQSLKVVSRRTRQASVARPPRRWRKASRGCRPRSSPTVGPRMMRGGPSPTPGPTPDPLPPPLPVPCPPWPCPGVGPGSGAAPTTSGCSGAARGGATTSGGGGAGRGRGGRTLEAAAGAPPPCVTADSAGGGGGGSGRSKGIRSTMIGGGGASRVVSGRPTPKSTKAPRCSRAASPAAPQRHCFIRSGRNRLSRTGFRTLTLQKSRRSDRAPDQASSAASMAAATAAMSPMPSTSVSLPWPS